MPELQKQDFSSATLRQKAERFTKAAQLIEQVEQLINSDKSRFSESGLARISERNRNLWAPCPLPNPCTMRDKETGELRVKKHRSQGRHTHPHFKQNVRVMPHGGSRKKAA